MEEQARNDLDIPLAAAYQQMLDENQRLRSELAGVAKANVLAAELMAELEETNEHLARTSEELKQEVSRRQLMEQMVFQSRSMLNNILNTSLDGIFVFQAVRDGYGRIRDFEFLVANPAAIKLFGGQGPLVGKRMLEVFADNQEQNLFDAYVGLVETGEPLKKELALTQDGVQSWFHVVGVKLGDGLSVTFRNISELRNPAGQLSRPEAMRT